MHPGAGGAKRARTGAAPTAEDSSDDEDDGVTLATLQKKGKARDKKKSHKAKKRAAGTARPWTPVEDQLLCAIVHEFGSNWGLITDVFAASAPFKGCIDARSSAEAVSGAHASAEGEGDPNAMAALNLNKGSARQTMSRALPVEDNTARLHSIAPRRRRRDTSNCDDNTPPNERGTTCRDVRPRTIVERASRAQRRIRSNWRTRR